MIYRDARSLAHSLPNEEEGGGPTFIIATAPDHYEVLHILIGPVVFHIDEGRGVVTMTPAKVGGAA